MKTIKSPEGVALLMENLWLRHKTGMKQRPCNVFMVELPPLTEEELAETRHKRHRMMPTRMMTLRKSMAHGYSSDE